MLPLDHILHRTSSVQSLNAAFGPHSTSDLFCSVFICCLWTTFYIGPLLFSLYMLPLDHILHRTSSVQSLNAAFGPHSTSDLFCSVFKCCLWTTFYIGPLLFSLYMLPLDHILHRTSSVQSLNAAFGPHSTSDLFCSVFKCCLWTTFYIGPLLFSLYMLPLDHILHRTSSVQSLNAAFGPHSTSYLFCSVFICCLWTTFYIGPLLFSLYMLPLDHIL